MPRAAVAMSGGVDSSVAALLLADAGLEPVGFSMRLWDQRRNPAACDLGPDGRAGGAAAPPARCCSPDDLYDAREVAARIGIPYYVVDFQKEFEHAVVAPFVEEYRRGRTPSPCVHCNSRLKFDLLARLGAQVGADAVATGHYARIVRDAASGRRLLVEARDKAKDQSYFLFELTQGQLARAMFPLGELTKAEVRRIARERGVPSAEKAESQEICFVPDGDYAAFVERYAAEDADGGRGAAPPPRGEIVDVAGRVLGTHAGIHRFTVGQRRGIGVAHSEPLYVLEIRPWDNTVVVGGRALLGRGGCRVERPNWIAVPELRAPMRVEAKIRSRHAPAPALIEPSPDGGVAVTFDEPQHGVTPGQACVFYRGEVVVGGGWIASADGKPWARY
ncbi:MAG: tRNA 2-thiouridine(34) synthase MnmA [Acidobacteriota bacterium]|jgi:tRNA-specific 2-thiouridylase|nr:tRNA 2-thiouridine(34) synthase MnmA [Acidobacteriota bacterium]